MTDMKLDLNDPREVTKLGILGVSSLVGGVVLFGAASSDDGSDYSWEKIQRISHAEPLPVQLVAFLGSLGGVVLGGSAFREMLGYSIKTWGRERTLTVGGALLLSGLAVSLAKELAHGRQPVHR